MASSARRLAPTTAPTMAHGGVRELDKTAIASRTVSVVGGDATGGDGGVTAFHDGGGRVLQHAQIHLIFWGSAWNSAAAVPSRTDVTNALTAIVTGPWGTQLAQYRGIGPMSVSGAVTISSSNPPTVFTDPDIKNMIEANINNGTLPAPSNSIDRIYAVLMPTGHSSGDTVFVGQHQFYDHGGQRVFWCWVTNDGTLTGGNSLPKVFSHEIAETVSDGDLSSGILVDVGTDKNEEIGDVCNNTFSVINGVCEEAYWSNADSRCVLPRLQAFPAVQANPALIQSHFGAKGNFELLEAAGSGGLLHFWRNDDNPYLPWSGAKAFGSGSVQGLTMIESNFGTPGNLEVLARVGNQLQFYWRDSGPAFHWNGPFALMSGVDGTPALIQGHFGSKGNFELVVPSSGAGLLHFWRNNDLPLLPWSGPTSFGASLGHVDAVTMIESNFGSPGNLEVIARVGNQLHFFWRYSGPAFHWNGPFPLFTGVAGNPVLIQSRFGTKGNFELVVPSATSGLIHFWRNNDNPSLPWSGPTPFGGSMGHVDAVSMIESNFGAPGNLEVIARVGSATQFMWRDSGPAFHWNGPVQLQSTVW
jgi:hypothetical protein